MIEKVTAYKSSDGKTFESLEAVQEHEVCLILSSARITPDPVEESVHGKIVANVTKLLVGHKDRVIDILTTGPRSKPKARAINGGRKSRKSTQQATPQPTTTA